MVYFYTCEVSRWYMLYMLSLHHTSCTFYRSDMHTDTANGIFIWCICYVYEHVIYWSWIYYIISIYNGHLHDIDHLCMHAFLLTCYRFTIMKQFIWCMCYVYEHVIDWSCLYLHDIEHLSMLWINVYSMYIINRCMSLISGVSYQYYPMYDTYVIDQYCIKHTR